MEDYLNKARAAQILALYGIQVGDIEKAKTFQIGQIDKAGKHVKTANGWVPIKTNAHHVNKDLEENKQHFHLFTDSKEPKKEKPVEKPNVAEPEPEAKKQPEVNEDEKSKTGYEDTYAAKLHKVAEPHLKNLSDEDKSKMYDLINIHAKSDKVINKFTEDKDSTKKYSDELDQIEQNHGLSTMNQYGYAAINWDHPLHNTHFGIQTDINNFKRQAIVDKKFDNYKAKGYDVNDHNLNFAKMIKDFPEKKEQRDFFNDWQKNIAKKFSAKQNSLGLAFNDQVRKMFITCDEKGINLNSDPDEFYSKANLLDEKTFKEAIVFRGVININKSFDGEWRKSDIPVLKNIENFANTLPNGHFKNNSELTNMKSHGIFGETYAHYSTVEKAISFSDKLSYKGQHAGDLKNPGEFEHVFVHELGHAVSRKLQTLSSSQYKQWGKIVGWDENNLQSGSKNGTAIIISRKLADFPLVSRYAETNAEEAFAEFYSMYTLNKEAIDKTLEGKKAINESYKDGRNTMHGARITGMYKPIFEFMRDKVFRDAMIKSEVYDIFVELNK